MHKAGFALVWRSGTHTPEQFFEEAGDQGELFMQIAGMNVQHIASVAQQIGRTLHDYILPVDYVPPRQYTVSNGVVTLAPL